MRSIPKWLSDYGEWNRLNGYLLGIRVPRVAEGTFVGVQ